MLLGYTGIVEKFVKAILCENSGYFIQSVNVIQSCWQGILKDVFVPWWSGN